MKLIKSDKIPTLSQFSFLLVKKDPTKMSDIWFFIITYIVKALALAK